MTAAQCFTCGANGAQTAVDTDGRLFTRCDVCGDEYVTPEQMWTNDARQALVTEGKKP